MTHIFQVEKKKLKTNKNEKKLKNLIISFKFQPEGKYLSETLILASTNPQYEDIFFIELRVQYRE